MSSKSNQQLGRLMQSSSPRPRNQGAKGLNESHDYLNQLIAVRPEPNLPKKQ